MMRPAPIFAALLTLSAGAAAQTTAPEPMAGAAPACTAPAALPPALAAFARPVPVTPGGGVRIGQAATLDLGLDTPFAVAPGHAPAGGTFGGLIGFDVKDAGTYRVALGTAIWIDMVKDGAAIRSTAHDRGPACSGVRKTVDFPLTRGRHTLQFSGGTTPGVTFLIVRLA